MDAVPVGFAVLISFLAGLASFISPCVLPLVPSYLSFVTGMSLEDLQEGVDRRNTLIHSVLFVVGFSAIFILLGAGASFLGQFLQQYKVWIPRVGGVIIVVFGLHLIGVLRFAPLLREYRVHLQDKPAGHVGTLAVGMAFGAGWTPCLGPVLGGILTFAGTSENLGSGVGLLSAYSAGLAVPFLASAVAMERFLEAFQRFRRFLPAIQMASGAVLVLLGVLLVTGSFTVLTAFLYQLTPEFLLDFEFWMLDERIDLRKALLNPALVFRDPEDVLKRDELAREEKIEILHRWKFDALQLQVAEEENMGSEQPSDILDRVLQALNALNAVP